MRQRGMTEEDRKFRLALENLRFGSCTQQDIALLFTRIAGPLPNQPKVTSPQFRHVSIVTAKNAVRDAAVAVRPGMHAIEKRKLLGDFLSIDSFPNAQGSASVSETRRLSNHTCDPLRTSNVIPSELRNLLWSLPPRRTEHVAGRLQLCEGMPVLLKANEATELCATNGAEGIVVGWDADAFPDIPNAYTLKTLFIQLSNPPHDIQLPGLPLNVVPVTPSTVHFTVKVDRDMSLRISRSQVQVLPNFAMTDFACQGRTRPFNVVDLRDCKTHMSLYTVLSRGCSLCGTLILYPFDVAPACNGMHADLLREFRELEILAAVTELEYNGVLPFSTHGQMRSYVISQFQAWKGIHYVPDDVHPALRWDTVPPSMLEPTSPSVVWKILNSSAPSSSASIIHTSVKRRSSASLNDRPTKRPCISQHFSVPESSRLLVSPLGFKWDNINWSCAYDSLFMILYNLVHLGRVDLTCHPGFAANSALQCLHEGFSELLSSSEPQLTPENVRDSVRDVLATFADSTLPRFGSTMSNIDSLLNVLFSIPSSFAALAGCCTGCHVLSQCSEELFMTYILSATSFVFSKAEYPQSISVQAIFNKLLLYHTRVWSCASCHTSQTYTTTRFLTTPLFLAIELIPTDVSMPNVLINYAVDLHEFNSGQWELAGVIYLGGGHFTSRFIDEHQRVWSHDGISQSNCATYCGLLPDVDLKEYNGRRISYLLYIPSRS
ncbi:hypothetical protein BDY19DRAFT_892557 [Irpex rosettiformis]|uniref:Uncharacterized protein n=1 Tax=Irpex rosettiformis TaxID=378272 RepID=A0ACB8U0F2_9APHY|nr:hypothetical protein BDY19DRAFT_892557 [Irpex rosettiformis]